jgi:hypothetical protein
MKFSRFPLYIFFSAILVMISWFEMNFPYVAQSQTNIPTRLMPDTTGKQILLPDWQRIPFKKMPPIQKSGSVKINGTNRKWNASDTPDKYLTLGDVDTALKPELFSLSNIGTIINYPVLNQSNLNSFPLLGKQTLQHLAEIVPNLGITNANTIKPICRRRQRFAIAALLKAKSPQSNTNISLSNSRTYYPKILHWVNSNSIKLTCHPTQFPTSPILMRYSYLIHRLAKHPD